MSKVVREELNDHIYHIHKWPYKKALLMSLKAPKFMASLEGQSLLSDEEMLKFVENCLIDVYVETPDGDRKLDQLYCQTHFDEKVMDSFLLAMKVIEINLGNFLHGNQEKEV